MPPGIGYNRNSQSSAPSYGGQPNGPTQQRSTNHGFTAPLDGPTRFGPQQQANTFQERMEMYEDEVLVKGPGGQLVRVPRSAVGAYSDLTLMELSGQIDPGMALYIRTMQDLQQSLQQMPQAPYNAQGGGAGMFFGGL